MNKESSVMIIALYDEMEQMYQNKLNELGLEFQIDCTSKLNYGQDEKSIVKNLQNLFQDRIDVVITRGVMAKTIRKHFDIQLIETSVSGYNILEVLHKYLNYSGVIGVVECDVFTRKVKRLGELLGLNIRIYEVDGIDDFNPQIKKAVRDGVNVILGGVWILHYPELLEGSDVIFETIRTSEDEINESVMNALRIYENVIREKHRNEMLNSVLNYSKEGIIAIDNQGRVTTFNHEAQKVLHIEKKNVLGRQIQEVLPELELEKTIANKKIVFDDVCRLNKSQIIMNKVPMIIENRVEGAIATFMKLDDIQDIEKNARIKLSKKGLTAKLTFDDIKGQSEVTIKNIQNAMAYAKIDSTVLITGETGTGKEVFAQAIHNGSQRKKSPFVAINCSALPPNLLESELFGYVEGAFTGARKGGKQGLFELAHGGTIFLDEIGELDKGLQVRLLRVLQEREVMRIGDDRIIPIDVRIISATNRELMEEVKKGNFRADLYYRLHILNIHLQPLRKRKVDLRELVDVIIPMINNKLRFKVTGLDSQLLEALVQYDWPGNIRELRNVLEKIIVLTQIGTMKYEEVGHVIEDLEMNTAEEQYEDLYELTLPEIEKRVIEHVLKEESYNKNRTAERLGIGRSTLFRKINSFSDNKFN